jgi:hypothetical protein
VCVLTKKMSDLGYWVVGYFGGMYYKIGGLVHPSITNIIYIKIRRDVK